MKRRGLYLALLLTVACYGSQQSACDFGRGPTPALPTPTPTATPTATPTPSPTPTLISCDPDWLKIDGPAILPVREKAIYWLTPMQNYVENGAPKTRPVPDSCNVPKASSVQWSLPHMGDSFVTVLPDGFSAVLTRVASGQVTLQVVFEGLIAQKVIQ